MVLPENPRLREYLSELVSRLAATVGDDLIGFELELNGGAGIAFHAALVAAGRAADGGAIWYAVDRSILRGHRIALLGHVPCRDVRGSARAGPVAVAGHRGALASGGE